MGTKIVVYVTISAQLRTYLDLVESFLKITSLDVHENYVSFSFIFFYIYSNLLIS